MESRFEEYLLEENELDDYQINRCYAVFDFEDNEYITCAWYIRELDQIVIQYTTDNISENYLRGMSINSILYEPDLNSKEGQKKINYILFGKERLA